MISISIVIVTWNSQETLPNCISSLFAYVPFEDFEVFIVDNHSDSTNYLELYDDLENITIIKNPGNFGYSKAVNIGLKKSSGNFSLVLNPDVIFTSNPFPKLIHDLMENPEIGVIGPLLFNVKDEAQIIGYYPVFPSLAQFILTRTLIAEKITILQRWVSRYFHAKIEKERLYYVDQIPGAFMLFRKDLFGNEPFNEAYFIWMEDVDFCQRVHQRKLKVAVAANEKITHIGGVSFKKRDFSWRRFVSTESYITYARLYFTPFKYQIQMILIGFDSIVRIIVFPIFRLGKGFQKIAAHTRLELKILKLACKRAIVR